MEVTNIADVDRVSFSKLLQQALFREIMRNNCLTLDNLANSLKVSRWTVKHWKSGVYSIPGVAFKKLYFEFEEARKFSEQCPFDIKQANWGAKKGGLVSSGKINNKELKVKMARVRSFIKREKFWRTPSHIELTPEVCEFLGIVMGDGCLSEYCTKNPKRKRYCVVITCHIDEKGYLENHVMLLIKKIFNKNPRVKCDKRNNVSRIDIFNQEVFNYMNVLGIPIGKKKNLRIPEGIIELPWEIKKNLVLLI